MKREIVDYTKRETLPIYGIVKCPKCGKVALQYKAPYREMYIHVLEKTEHTSSVRECYLVIKLDKDKE